MTAPLPTLRRSRQAPPIIHAAAFPYDRARCGKPRGDTPFKPGAKVTCVVCLSLRGEL